MSDHPPSDNGPRPLSMVQRVDQVCDRFEATWTAAGSGGQRPRIEDHLGGTPEPERSELLRELLALELAYRRDQGEKSTVQEYQGRIPGHADLVKVAFNEQTVDRYSGRPRSAPPARSSSNPA
jgi:hypothetical protein